MSDAGANMAVRQPTYLDTSALMRRAEGLAKSCSGRNSKIAPVIEAILDDPSRDLACSELTLIEHHNNLTTSWRNGSLPDCDEDWWIRARGDLFDRIADGTLTVRPTPPKAVEQVMALVTMATRDMGRALRAWDAMHAVSAARWALDLGRPVEIVTSDEDFDVVLEVAGMTNLLSVVNLDVAASTGEGADRVRA